MTDIANLTLAINVLLAQMDEHFGKARAAMGVKPDLELALREAQAAHGAIVELGVLILRAQNFHGISQPPDVIKRINDRYREISDIAGEITMCKYVIATGNRRPASGVGKHAPN